MVLGIAMIATTIPTIFGLNEASNAMRDREKNPKESARKTRFGLCAVCDASEGSIHEREQVHNSRVYLGRDRKVSTTYLILLVSELSRGIHVMSLKIQIKS
jgi:hypothetical protein